MKYGKAQKKLLLFVGCAALGIILCGGKIMAAIAEPQSVNQRGTFDFVVTANQDDDSDMVQKVASYSYADVTVSSYSNNTNKNFLRLRVRRGSDPVSEFRKVTMSPQYLLINYYPEENVRVGQYVYLRGKTAEAAISGSGTMNGIWTP